MNEGATSLELWEPLFEWLKVIALIFGFICFFSFAWAIKRLFVVSKAGVSAQMKVLGYVGIVFYVMHVTVLYRSTVFSLWLPAVGVIGYLSALSLFWWSVPAARAARLAIAFDPSRSAFVQMRGPYAYIRHPFYASYLLFWLSGVVAAGSAWLVLTFVVMAGFYTKAIRREEMELGQGSLSECYGAYKACTPALIPRFWHRPIHIPAAMVKRPPEA